MDFDRDFDKTIQYEGGYVDNSEDYGGPTNYGITEAVARANGYTGDMRDMPLDFAKQVYKSEYWDKLSLDQISSIHQELAFCLFDMSVNMGVGTAGMALQRSVNVLTNYNIAVDGMVGNGTIGAVRSIGYTDCSYLVKLINILRGMKYIGICESKPSQKTFIKGWLNRVQL